MVLRLYISLNTGITSSATLIWCGVIRLMLSKRRITRRKKKEEKIFPLSSLSLSLLPPKLPVFLAIHFVDHRNDSGSQAVQQNNNWADLSEQEKICSFQTTVEEIGFRRRSLCVFWPNNSAPCRPSRAALSQVRRWRWENRLHRDYGWSCCCCRLTSCLPIGIFVK